MTDETRDELPPVDENEDEAPLTDETPGDDDELEEDEAPK